MNPRREGHPQAWRHRLRGQDPSAVSPHPHTKLTAFAAPGGALSAGEPPGSDCGHDPEASLANAMELDRARMEQDEILINQPVAVMRAAARAAAQVGNALRTSRWTAQRCEVDHPFASGSMASSAAASAS